MTRRDSDSNLSRRSILAAGIGAAMTACSGGSDDAAIDLPTSTSTSSTPPISTSTDPPVPTSDSTEETMPPSVEMVTAPSWTGSAPFTLGVASGDPDATSVVLWTRLAPDPHRGGGMPEPDQQVAVDMAVDEAFSHLKSSVLVDARASDAHSIHHVATDLEPDSWYWYRFRLGEHTSMPGRTRTTPAAGATTVLRFAFSSCQNWESGAYAAHGHLAEADLDLFVFLGDYIYEYGPGNRGVVSSAGLREHDSPEVTDLDGYRNRYALYKTDPQLQASHAAHPWVITWDDHEVDNDHAGLWTEDGQDADAFRLRRAAAYRAWWEHQPVRLDPPTDDSIRIHRTISWGDLADLHMLDGRQYRDPRPTDGERVRLPGAAGFDVRRLGPTALDPSHSMLGTDQEQWLIDAVDSSGSIWQLLGNQVFMHGLNAFPGSVPATATDTWDGYAANRTQLLEALSPTDNLVILTGDFHSTSVADVRADPFDSTSPVVAAEFMAPAISSTFPEGLRALAPLVVSINPQIKFFDPDNGFMVCRVDESQMTTYLHLLDDVTDENSPISIAASFTVDAGSAGIATVSVAET